MQPPPPAEDAVPPPVVPPPAPIPLAPPANSDPQKMSQVLMTNMMNLMMRLTRPEKHVQSSEQDMTLPPLRTLYVNNLNDRVKIPKLQEQLRAKFGPFGEIESILTMKSFWRRGQAFVSFKTQEAATQALESLQGQMLEGKPMRINYARAESDCLRKEEEGPVKRERGAKKPRAIRERESLLQEQFLQLQQQMTAFQQQGFAAPIMEPVTKEEEVENEAAATEESRKRKVFSLSLKGSTEDVKKRRETPAPPALPHKTLFLENLPPDVQESELTNIFGSLDGFERIRIAVRSCGFVDFKSIPQASAALQACNGKEIREGYPVCASFARR